MRIGLFIPCYMNDFYPDISMSTLEILERLGLEVDYPLEQTCCGQPMANSGCTRDLKELALRFLRIFKDYDYIVGPSGSCVAMVRVHYDQFIAGEPGFDRLKERTFELCEFLHDVIKVEKFDVSFPYKVGLHNSCHGHRDLRLGNPSELHIPCYSKLENLLRKVDGLELVSPQRPDECCGFGGTFAVSEKDVSVVMGNDRIADHLNAGAEVMTGADVSCLMHMDGLVRRQGKPLRVMHMARILNGEAPNGTS